MSKELELIARGLADAADDGCFDNPPCCDEPPCSDECGTDLDEWHSGEEDRQWWLKLAAAGLSRLSEHGYSIVKVECDGSGTCPVELHVHGCFSDTGNCDNPDDHVCHCGTCKAIEADRVSRAAAAAAEEDQ